MSSIEMSQIVVRMVFDAWVWTPFTFYIKNNVHVHSQYVAIVDDAKQPVAFICLTFEYL